MTDSSRIAARDLYSQAADAGVAPLLLSGSPWALRPDMLAQVAAAARMPTMAGAPKAATTERPTMAGVAVIPLTGIITPQGSFLSFLFGGAPGGLLAFREAFMEALGSPEVGAIVLDVDSPGGLVDLVPETAQMIRDARGTKPITAVADTQMCSAAYWLAAQADELVITPSGYAGSIGVYRVHEDWSKFNAEMGIDVSYVYAGRYKTEGNMDAALEGEALEHWQEAVDDAYALFVEDVAAGRGRSTADVISGYGEGRALNAKRALAAGVVDRVATYEQVVSGLIGSAVPEGQQARVEAVVPPVVAEDDPAPVVAEMTPEERAEVFALLFAA